MKAPHQSAIEYGPFHRSCDYEQAPCVRSASIFTYGTGPANMGRPIAGNARASNAQHNCQAATMKRWLLPSTHLRALGGRGAMLRMCVCGSGTFPSWRWHAHPCVESRRAGSIYRHDLGEKRTLFSHGHGSSQSSSGNYAHLIQAGKCRVPLEECAK